MASELDDLKIHYHVRSRTSSSLENTDDRCHWCRAVSRGTGIHRWKFEIRIEFCSIWKWWWLSLAMIVYSFPYVSAAHKTGSVMRITRWSLCQDVRFFTRHSSVTDRQVQFPSMSLDTSSLDHSTVHKTRTAVIENCQKREAAHAWTYVPIFRQCSFIFV